GVTAAVPAPTTSDGFDPILRITCVGAAIVAMIIALVLLRRGTRLSVPAPRSPRVRPGPAGAYSAATADRLETYGENSGDADRGAGPQTWRLDESPPRPTPEALLTGERGRLPMATDDTTEVPMATGPVAEPGDPYAQVMEVQVLAASGQDRATVRLAGVRTPRAMPAWIWLDPDEPRPPAPTYVAVGAAGQGALCLDLLQAPDVVTVTGDTAPARRLAAVLARQLVDNGTPVTVVGPILGPRIAGTHVVRSMAAAEETTAATTADPVAPQIVFCPPGPDDAATVRRFTTRSSPRTVVVIVGDVRRGRWSVEVHATK
ncbi:MAG: hypothetical protein QOE61_3322, partial [Micromonosporaceae bacterium]|nr:hypothetical protein [Micromonosporaceae bacterium]